MLLEIDDLTVTYKLPAKQFMGHAVQFNAVDKVSLCIADSEAFGLVGETGCGKSSLARAIAGLAPITAGQIKFRGIDQAAAAKAQLRTVRKNLQMIFQDPGGSLNPRMRCGALIAEPLDIYRVRDRAWRRDRAVAMLESIGLSAADAQRYPHELSGGQRQRIAIARAVILEPALVVADEPVSALDVSLQAQILNLIVQLRSELGLALLFISHDLNVVRYLCSRVAVMYLGKIVEYGSTATVLASPRHPYTQALVASSPVADPDRRITLNAPAGEPPNPAAPPQGCRYHPRCPYAAAQCSALMPDLQALDSDRYAACHYAEKIHNETTIKI